MSAALRCYCHRCDGQVIYRRVDDYFSAHDVETVPDSQLEPPERYEQLRLFDWDEDERQWR